MAIFKTKEEIDQLKHSCLILMSAYKLGKSMIKPGADCGEINQAVDNFIRSKGGVPSFLGHHGYKFACCISINEEVVHGLPLDGKKIPEEGLIKLDMGVNYQGYFSDSAQTIIVGEVSQKLRDLSEATRKSLYAGISTVKAGARVGDIGFAVEKSLESRGFKKGNVLDLGGHGVGRAVWEDPFISHSGKPKKGDMLMENQAICIEPMVCLGLGDVDFDETHEDGWTVRSSDGTWSAHWEHTILVTAGGAEILTEIPEENLLK